MRRRCGVVLRPDQEYLLESRLAGPAAEAGCATIGEFVSLACAPHAPPRASALLIDAMTTHETSFFRDPGFWKTFSEVVLPRLRPPSSADRPLRLWSAACSTGQEPYSLAMLLDEAGPGLAETTRIVATDVSELSVERARNGLYTALEVNRGLTASRLVRHFEHDRGGFRARRDLRTRIEWGTYNLLGAQPPPGRFDVVLCRNVLIYFDATDRQAAIRRLFDALVPGGYLGVGSTELVPGTPIAAGWYQVPAAARSAARDGAGSLLQKTCSRPIGLNAGRFLERMNREDECGS